ncbi:putative multidrug-efflux transporter [Nonomuraea coxensis DSM 45129]|uniref:Multidrug-efflux transporter n=1 Tax=Nonomuraea coxensis DSM 45129 TaxID=1122611 RepID=A0ABX8U7G5_9ACTN|nr:MFS transporter [Nonomuraea coxensis]QYC43425.1 putative multidrug-efflux transporter [Nonomuraea coxensis DSM 45129]
MTTTVGKAPAAGGVVSAPYRALSFGLVAIVTLMAFEAMAVATAMPVVARELHGMRLYNLAFSATLAASVIATVLGGRWSDRRGPLEPIAAGVATFVAGLLLAGFAPDMEVFVAGRFVQGLGAGATQVALYVLVARVYPAALHPKVFALFSAAWVVPSMVGPAIAGFVVENADWRWIFLGVSLIVVPSALLLWRGTTGRDLGADPGRTPGPGADPSDPGLGADPSDPGLGADPSDPGLAAGPVEPAPAPGLGRKLAWAAVTAVAAALIQYGSAMELAGLPLLAAGVVLLAVALPRLLLPGSLRAAPGLPTAPVLRGLAFGSLTAAQVLIPLMLINERGLSATAAGIVLTIGALGWSTGSWLKGRGRISNLLAVRGGAALLATGLALVTLVLVDAVPLALAHVAMALAGLGIGMLHPTVSVLVLEMSAPGEEGQNSAAVGVGESVFTVVAVAASGAVFTASGGSYAAGLLTAVALAVLAFALAPRLVRSRTAGTMEVSAP